jgi:hypothetical protein
MTNSIILGICGYQQVPFEFVFQLANLYSTQGPIRRTITTGGLHLGLSRTIIVNRALEEENWDYLLFLDTDMVLPGNLIERVGEYSDPVVGGMYWSRFPPFSPVPGMMDGVQPTYTRLSPDQLVPMLDEPNLYPVDVLGTGCMAIHHDVLADWPSDRRPIFTTMQPVDREDIVSEDVYFCWRLKQQGIQPLLDTHLCCGHIASVIIDKAAYLHNVSHGRH